MNANLKNKKTIALLSTVGVLAIALISFTLAMLNQRSQAATNNFSGATVNIGVLENGEIYEDSANGKSNSNTYDKITEDNREVTKQVAIKNINSTEYPTSDTYVRVRLVPCFRYNDNAEKYAGEVVPTDIAKDVEYIFSRDTDWEKKGEYYYYKKPLAPDDTTDDLLEKVRYNGSFENIPADSHFELQVLTEGVSAKQADAAKNAWGDIPELQKPAPAADTTTN